MKINLRVVGIQFSADVTVTKKDPTIEDVMLAAGGGTTDFKFVKASDGTLRSASAHIPDKKSASSGNPYKAGLYELVDGPLTSNSVSTWQWYLVRGGKQLNTPDGKIDKFSKKLPPGLALQDGDQIVWRLVVVLTEATMPKGKSNFEIKAVATS
jgi:hypothetical protein